MSCGSAPCTAASRELSKQELDDEVGLGTEQPAWCRRPRAAVLAQIGGALDAKEEEIGVAAQPLAQEGRLVDHLGAGAHGLLGAGGKRLAGRRPSRPLGPYSTTSPAFGLERGGVALLVLIALAGKRFRRSRAALRLDLRLQPRARARVERRQMYGRQGQLSWACSRRG